MSLERRFAADRLRVALYDPARPPAPPGPAQEWGEGAAVGQLELADVEEGGGGERWVELWSGEGLVVSVEVAEASRLKAADAVASDPYVRIT